MPPSESDSTFPALVAAEMRAVHADMSPHPSPVAALRALGLSWGKIRDTAFDATNPAIRVADLVILASECQRAAEDLGLCLREEARP